MSKSMFVMQFPKQESLQKDKKVSPPSSTKQRQVGKNKHLKFSSFFLVLSKALPKNNEEKSQ